MQQVQKRGSWCDSYFVENFGTIHDFGFASFQQFPDLSCNQCLAGARRTKQQHALDVPNTELSNHRWWKETRRERAPKDVPKFRIQTTDTHLGKRPIRS